MKNGKLIKSLVSGVAIAALAATASAQVSKETLESITTPDKVWGTMCMG